MDLVLHTGVLVTLLALASVVTLVVVCVLLFSEDPLGDELAQSVRQSAELLDTCAHSIDGRPLGEAAFGDLSGGRWRTPAPRLRLSHPSTGPAAATHI